MTARLWRGWTTPAHADAYERLLRTTILPHIADEAGDGYCGAHLLRREASGEVAFVTLLWFDSLEAVRRFAGADYETAVVPEEAQKLLKRYDAAVQHFDAVLTPDRPPS